MLIAGAFRFFRALGVTVYIHWLWVIVVMFEVQANHNYRNRAWALAEVLSLFGIVLLHEFGHALACRSTGGRADTIILWPLGGVAFVSPPMRPGAWLWSLAAGPLVNVALIPVTLLLVMASGNHVYITSAGELTFRGLTDLQILLSMMAMINTMLLVFNMLPIYPLDGGQIVQSLLWFVIGFQRSLRIVSIFGLFVAITGGLFLLYQNQLWLTIMAVFIGMRSFAGYQRANAIRRAELQREQMLRAAFDPTFRSP